jgi:hypothetical protein
MPVMDVADLVQAAVSLPGVGYHDCARFDVVSDEGVQRGRGTIRHRCHTASPESSRLGHLDRDCGENLLAPGPAATQARFITADVGLIDLHDPRQPVPARA